MMHVLIVMVMLLTRFLSLPDRLWFKRSKSDRIRILFRQLDKYYNHCLRIDLRVALTLKHIILRRLQLDRYFAPGLIMLNTRLTLSTISFNLLTCMIGHIKYKLSILDNKLQMIWTCRTDLPAMWRRHSIQLFVSMCPNRLKYNQGGSQHRSNDRFIHFVSPQHTNWNGRGIFKDILGLSY